MGGGPGGCPSPTPSRALWTSSSAHRTTHQPCILSEPPSIHGTVLPRPGRSVSDLPSDVVTSVEVNRSASHTPTAASFALEAGGSVSMALDVSGRLVSAAITPGGDVIEFPEGGTAGLTIAGPHGQRTRLIAVNATAVRVVFTAPSLGAAVEATVDLGVVVVLERAAASGSTALPAGFCTALDVYDKVKQGCEVYTKVWPAAQRFVRAACVAAAIAFPAGSPAIATVCVGVDRAMMAAGIVCQGIGRLPDVPLGFQVDCAPQPACGPGYSAVGTCFCVSV